MRAEIRLDEKLSIDLEGPQWPMSYVHVGGVFW